MLRFPFLLPYGSSCSPIPELREIPLLCVPFMPLNPMNRICRGRDAAGKLEFHLGFSEDKRVNDVLDPSPLNPRWTVETPKGLSSQLEDANHIMSIRRKFGFPIALGWRLPRTEDFHLEQISWKALR